VLLLLYTFDNVRVVLDVLDGNTMEDESIDPALLRITAVPGTEATEAPNLSNTPVLPLNMAGNTASTGMRVPPGSTLPTVVAHFKAGFVIMPNPPLLTAANSSDANIPDPLLYTE
jgi:hypothetical protein